MEKEREGETLFRPGWHRQGLSRLYTESLRPGPIRWAWNKSQLYGLWFPLLTLGL